MDHRLKARVIYCSSEEKDHPCSNILIGDAERLWISATTSALTRRIEEFVLEISTEDLDLSSVIKVVGWNCYKKYYNNPRCIEISLSRQWHGSVDATQWEAVVTLTAKKNEGIHLFKVQPPLNPHDFRYMRCRILETFTGPGGRVFLSKLFILTEIPMSSPARRKISPDENVKLESPIQSREPRVAAADESSPGEREKKHRALLFEVRSLPQKLEHAANETIRKIDRAQHTAKQQYILSSLAELDREMALDAPSGHLSPSPLVTESFYEKDSSAATATATKEQHPSLFLPSTAAKLVSREQPRVYSSPPPPTPPAPPVPTVPDATHLITNALQDLQHKISRLEIELQNQRRQNQQVESTARTSPRKRTHARSRSLDEVSISSLSSFEAEANKMRYEELDARVKQLRRDLDSYVQQSSGLVGRLQQRLELLEEANVLPFLQDYKNMGAELRKEMAAFKQDFTTKFIQKVKKSFRTLDERINEQISSHVESIIREEISLLRGDMNAKIVDAIQNLHLTHPENASIHAYNQRVRALNKKLLASPVDEFTALEQIEHGQQGRSQPALLLQQHVPEKGSRRYAG